MRFRVVIFTLLFFFCGIFSSFSQEGRFHITGDDVNSQLQWLDLETGNQFFSLVGVSAIRTGPPGVYYTIHNSNKYRVTVIYRFRNNINIITLEPGGSISGEGEVSLLNQLPR